MCFPWAIVEVKHDDTESREGDKCYRQAANASAAALDIERSLVKSLRNGPQQPIYPVTAFTCRGRELKVWLAFWQVVDDIEVRVSHWHSSLRLCPG